MYFSTKQLEGFYRNNERYISNRLRLPFFSETHGSFSSRLLAFNLLEIFVEKTDECSF